MTYTASTSNDAIIFVDMHDSELEVKGEGFRTATVTVVATDQIGQSATQEFDVTVADTPDTGYRIEVRFLSSISASAQAAILGAASFWESVLADNEFFDYHVGGRASCGGYGTQVDTIDDLMVLVGTQNIDGAGGLWATPGTASSEPTGRSPFSAGWSSTMTTSTPWSDRAI